MKAKLRGIVLSAATLASALLGCTQSNEDFANIKGVAPGPGGASGGGSTAGQMPDYGANYPGMDKKARPGEAAKEESAKSTTGDEATDAPDATPEPSSTDAPPSPEGPDATPETKPTSEQGPDAGAETKPDTPPESSPPGL